ncbi:MAG: hypothetical protein WC955_04715 [Elusimicrobiota bacterium]
MMYKKIWFIYAMIAILAILNVSACGKKKVNKNLSQGQTDNAQAEVKFDTSTVRPIVVWSYDGDRYRDPFIQLTGDSYVYMMRASTMAVQPDVASLQIRGILSDKSGQYAILTDRMGLSFILKNGKLIDPKGNIVEKIAGNITKDGVRLIPEPSLKPIFIGIKKERR